MAARVTKATLALKNSIPLIAKDDGKEESRAGFEQHTQRRGAHTKASYRGCAFEKKHTYTQIVLLSGLISVSSLTERQKCVDAGGRGSFSATWIFTQHAQPKRWENLNQSNQRQTISSSTSSSLTSLSPPPPLAGMVMLRS